MTEDQKNVSSVIIWLVGIIFAAGGLAVMVHGNTCAIDKNSTRLSKVENATSSIPFIREDIQEIKSMMEKIIVGPK